MSQLDYRTAGESHGRALTVLVEHLPAGLRVDIDLINSELARRQGGYGRGGRMKIEKDAVEILSGTRNGVTIGSPLVMMVPNRDFRIDSAPPITRPRPGHADFAGAMKFLTTDCRETLERASARETTMRVAAGALAKCILREFDITCVGFVASIGPVVANIPDAVAAPQTPLLKAVAPGDLAGIPLLEAVAPGFDTAQTLVAARDSNEVYCPDSAAVRPMIEAIRQAKKDGDTLGGIVEVRVFNLPPGLGSCMRWQDKLDGRLMQALGSVQAFKGVEIGLGFAAAKLPGSQVHDAIYFDGAQRGSHQLGFVRKTNRAGGLEGGMTNGAVLVVRGAMKPISTLMQGMDSVNLETLAAERSDYERSDVCAVPAASVVAENVVAFEVARAFLEKFGGDTLREVRGSFEFYMGAARGLGSVT